MLMLCMCFYETVILGSFLGVFFSSVSVQPLWIYWIAKQAEMYDWENYSLNMAEWFESLIIVMFRSTAELTGWALSDVYLKVQEFREHWLAKKNLIIWERWIFVEKNPFLYFISIPIINMCMKIQFHRFVFQMHQLS